MTHTEKASILLVDDRPDKLIAVATMLEDLGQTIVQANSGREALRCLLKEDFAVILLDVNMPDMDGFETASLIRQRKNSAHTPIIFMTAFSDETHVSRGYSLGAVDYILTPVEPEILRAKVSVFVELFKKTAEVKRQAELLRQVEEREHQRRLNQAKVRLEAETKRNRFFTLSIEMLAISGLDGYFRQLNPTWQSLLGFTEEEMTARPWLELIHPEDREDTRQAIERLSQQESSIYFENRCRCRDGSYRWLGWTAAPFIEEGLMYIFARDITERKTFEQTLREKNHELENAIRAKDRFLASMSHELRTPLNAIIGFTGTLLMRLPGPLTADQERQLRLIQTSGKHLLSIINDLLDLAKIDSGRLELNLEAVRCQEVVEEVTTTLKPMAAEKNLEFHVTLPLEDLVIQTDRRALSQILLNLTNNAIKFTEAGEVRVQLDHERLNGHRLTHITVADTGPGIREEDQGLLFQPFSQINGTSKRHPGGTGLGLHLSQKLAHLIGGEITCRSVSGRGSSFVLTLRESAGKEPIE